MSQGQKPFMTTLSTGRWGKGGGEKIPLRPPNAVAIGTICSRPPWPQWLSLVPLEGARQRKPLQIQDCNMDLSKCNFVFCPWPVSTIELEGLVRGTVLHVWQMAILHSKGSWLQQSWSVSQVILENCHPLLKQSGSEECLNNFEGRQSTGWLLHNTTRNRMQIKTRTGQRPYKHSKNERPRKSLKIAKQ